MQEISYTGDGVLGAKTGDSSVTHELTTAGREESGHPPPGPELSKGLPDGHRPSCSLMGLSIEKMQPLLEKLQKLDTTPCVPLFLHLPPPQSSWPLLACHTS